MKQDSNENMNLLEPPFPSLPFPRPVIVSPAPHLAFTSAPPLPLLILLLPLFSLCLSETAARKYKFTVYSAIESKPLTTGGGTREQTPSLGTLAKKIKKLAKRDVQQQLKTCLKALCNNMRVTKKSESSYLET